MFCSFGIFKSVFATTLMKEIIPQKIKNGAFCEVMPVLLDREGNNFTKI